MKTLLDTGCHVVAQAVKSARVDLVAAYPITPQTSVVEEIAALVDAGELDCRFLPVEGEHSAMAACVAAAAVGARAFTATSSQGLLYMHEILHMAAGCRFPIVMANVNRAVFAPWTIWTDHQDSIAQCDTGWLQYYCASLQEVYDTILQAYYVAERVRIPVMVNLDGFILSHCRMAIELPEQDSIDGYIPHQIQGWTADPAHPTVYAGVTGADRYPAYRQLLADDTRKAAAVMLEAALAYEKLTGNWHGGLIDDYRCEDAELFLFAMGSMAAEARLSIDLLREQGIKAGLLRLRVFRPFPKLRLNELVPDGATVLALDRNYNFGHEGGVLAGELKSALFGRNVRVEHAVMGIGGADVTYQQMAQAATAILQEGRA